MGISIVQAPAYPTKTVGKAEDEQVQDNMTTYSKRGLKVRNMACTGTLSEQSIENTLRLGSVV